MKRIAGIVVGFLFIAFPCFADYPPQGWTDSIAEGIERAEKEDKMLLLDFTGSDWCGWCHRLDAEVWETKAFQDWADENLVKVFLDFPRGITLSDDVVRQNQVLQQYFGVRGYPTVFIFDSDLTPLLKTGYRDGGAREYIRHIKEDRNLRMDSAAEFQAQFKSLIDEYITKG